MTEMNSLSKHPQLPSTTSLVSQRYQSKTIFGKALYRIKRALFARNGAFLLLLIGSILFISTVDWALWKISLNRFHAKHSNTTYTFFVLQLYSAMMLTLSFTAMMLSIYWLKTIDNRQRQFPQSKFVTMSAFDSVTSLCSSMSSASVAGHLQTLLSQGALPLIMVASIIMLRVHYTPYQVFGAACILTGTLIAAIPGVNSSDMSGRTTKLWAIILYSMSLIPLAIGNTYREYIFRDVPDEVQSNNNNNNNNSTTTTTKTTTKGNATDLDELQPSYNTMDDSPSKSTDADDEHTPFGTKRDISSSGKVLDKNNNNNNDDIDNDDLNNNPHLPKLNIFYLMFWTSLYQFLFTCLTFPVLTLKIFGGVPWKDIPTQFTNGTRCFFGYHVPELECEVGIQPGVILTVYVLFNFGLSILRLQLIKHGSALLLQITNALALLFSNIIFSWKFIMGEYTEKYSKYDFLGLIGVLIGFVIFQVGVYYKDLEEQRAKLLQEAFKQYADDDDNDDDHNQTTNIDSLTLSTSTTNPKLQQQQQQQKYFPKTSSDNDIHGDLVVILKDKQSSNIQQHHQRTAQLSPGPSTPRLINNNNNNDSENFYDDSTDYESGTPATPPGKQRLDFE